MSNLPKLEWNIDPIFFHIPRPVVLGVTALIAAYSIYQDIRKKTANPLWTILFFAGMTFLGWKFAEAKFGFVYYLGLGAAFVAEGMRRKASDSYVTAALFAGLGFVAWRFLPESLDLRYYSLLFVGVFLGGYSLLKWQIVRGGGPAEDAGDFIVYGVLGVLVGARLGHVLFYALDQALADPLWIFQIWTGGLASHGAVIGLIIAMWLFTKARGIPFLEGSDRFAFSAALGATLVRLGNLMNSEIVGRRVPGDAWGFAFKRFDHEGPVPYRYPTQIAEILLGLTVLGILFFVDKKAGKEKRPRGLLISTFFTVYFIGRFVIEFWKEYEPPLPAGTPYPTSLTTGQLLSLPGIALGFFGLWWAFKHKIPVGWPNTRVAEDDREPPKKGKARDEEDDDELDEEDEDEDDEEEEARRKKSKRAAATKVRDEDESDDDGDEEDDEERDADDDDDEDEGDEPGDKAPVRPSAQHDPDIDDEFDEKGALKRRRGPSDG
jgi:phosphatidylglycerol:prolipoprotein diacylglycerol transferase